MTATESPNRQTKYLVDDLTPTGYASRRRARQRSRHRPIHLRPHAHQPASTATSFYGYDAGGSVRQLFDNTGTVTDTYAYDAFGNTVAQAGSTLNEFQYRGEQYDASSCGYCTIFRARY